MNNTFNIVLCSELKYVHKLYGYDKSTTLYDPDDYPSEVRAPDHLYYNDYNIRFICYNDKALDGSIRILDLFEITYSSNVTDFIQELKSDPLNFYTALLYDNETDMFYEREMLFMSRHVNGSSLYEETPESDVSTTHNKVIKNIPFSLAGNYICNEFFHFINPFCGLVMAADISLELSNVSSNYYLSSSFIGMRTLELATECLFNAIDNTMNTGLNYMMKNTNIVSSILLVSSPIIGSMIIKPIYDIAVEYMEDLMHEDAVTESEYYIET